MNLNQHTATSSLPAMWPFFMSQPAQGGGSNFLSHIEQHFSEVLYIQAEGNYSKIVYEESPCEEFRILLKGLQGHLDQAIRVHKSFLVNPKKVKRAHLSGTMTYFLELEDGTIPVGRAYLKELQALYPQWFIRKRRSC